METNFLIELTWGWGNLAFVPWDVEGFELAADKPARSRLWRATSWLDLRREWEPGVGSGLVLTGRS